LSVLPAGDPDCTLMPNEPFTLPLKLPLKVNEPDSVSPETKHEELEVKLKFVTVSEPSVFTVNDVPKLKLVELPLLSRVAFHVPLMLAGFEFEPHPTRIRPATSKTVTAKCFTGNPPNLKYEGALKLDAENRAAGGFGGAGRSTEGRNPWGARLLRECKWLTRLGVCACLRRGGIRRACDFEAGCREVSP
jgi:hypothetical protein